jgi:hypothetical protein
VNGFDKICDFSFRKFSSVSKFSSSTMQCVCTQVERKDFTLTALCNLETFAFRIIYETAVLQLYCNIICNLIPRLSSLILGKHCTFVCGIHRKFLIQQCNTSRVFWNRSRAWKVTLSPRNEQIWVILTANFIKAYVGKLGILESHLVKLVVDSFKNLF